MVTMRRPAQTLCRPGKAGKMSKDERKKAKEEERQKQAELELLLMDDGALR